MSEYDDERKTGFMLAKGDGSHGMYHHPAVGLPVPSASVRVNGCVDVYEFL
jgi:hypothetical protein